MAREKEGGKINDNDIAAVQEIYDQTSLCFSDYLSEWKSTCVTSTTASFY